MDYKEYEEQLMVEFLRIVKYLGDIKMHKNDKNALRQKRLSAEAALSAVQGELEVIRSKIGGSDNDRNIRPTRY